MSAVKVLTEANFDSAIAGGGSAPVMVDFYADWCAPCQILGPKVEAVASQYQGRVTVAKFNVDQAPLVAMRYGIQGIPTVLFFKDGRLADRVVGLVPETELTRRLDNLLDANQ